MKTLLVVTEHLDFTETICSGLKPGQWRIINPHSPEQVGPLLERGCIDSCIVDADSSKDRGRSWLRTLQDKAPGCSIILYTNSRDSEWEREAYLEGASFVLAKPLDRRLVAALLDRPRPGTSSLLATGTLVPTPEKRANSSTESEAAAQTTHVLRGFSRMLSHSLSMEGLLRPFLHWLRDLLSINRAVIFLAEPQARVGHPVEARPGEELRPSCAFGLSPDCTARMQTVLGHRHWRTPFAIRACAASRRRRTPHRPRDPARVRNAWGPFRGAHSGPGNSAWSSPSGRAGDGRTPGQRGNSSWSFICWSTWDWL